MKRRPPKPHCRTQRNAARLERCAGTERTLSTCSCGRVVPVEWRLPPAARNGDRYSDTGQTDAPAYRVQTVLQRKRSFSDDLKQAPKRCAIQIRLFQKSELTGGRLDGTFGSRCPHFIPGGRC